MAGAGPERLPKEGWRGMRGCPVSEEARSLVLVLVAKVET